MEYKRYNKRVKALMAFYNLSELEFANKLDISPIHLTQVLSGQNYPNTEMFEQIAESFPDLNMRWFVTGEGEVLTK